MNQETIQKRLNELRVLQAQQRDRLAAAQAEMKAATDSLTLIDGAMQDCQYWLSILETQALEAAARNGQVPALLDSN